MPYELNPILEGTPGNPPTYNVGAAETFSWIPIQNNEGRPLFARATYVTNMSDMSINLEASELSIGEVALKDGNSSTQATIQNIGGGQGALKVITQDLESSQDDVTIGDVDGNLAKVNPVVNALQVVNVSEYGNQLSFNNIAGAGWTADSTLRPVLSIKKNSGALTKVTNFQLKSHDGSGVFGYEWWEGDLTILTGPGTPSWIQLGTQSYRIYQDVDGSNQGNTVSTLGATLIHSGILTNQDVPYVPFKGGIDDGLVRTLLIRRLDSNTEHKVYFAFTLEEYN